MWAVKVDGFTRAEFRHFASAAEFVEGLPGSEPESATIVATVRGGKNEHELSIRLTAWKRERIRMMRREKNAAKWGAL